MAKAKDVVQSFTGFLAKHSSELRALTGVFATVLSALPLGRQDREKIENVLEGLNEAADRIAAAAGNIAPVVVKKSDVEAAVRAVVPDLLKKLMEEQKNEPKK